MSDSLANLPAILFGAGILLCLGYAAAHLGLAFLTRRLVGVLFVVMGVSFITFVLASVNPDTAIFTQCTTKCTDHAIAALRNYYGLDQPWYVQYARYLVRVLHFDLGMSWQDRSRTVWSYLSGGVPASILLGVLGIGGQLALGVPLGIFAAVRDGSRLDTLLNTLGLLLIAMPVYLIIVPYQLLTILLIQHNLPHLPLSGWNDGPVDAVAPVLLLSIGGMGYYVRLMHTTMLDVLGKDFVRTARAKGLRERRVIMRHALRNALIPLLTSLGPALGSVVTGIFFIETAFNIPGIAFQSVNAIEAGDVPVMQATTNLAALSIVLLNLVTDIVYSLVDPRIQVT